MLLSLPLLEVNSGEDIEKKLEAGECGGKEVN